MEMYGFWKTFILAFAAAWTLPAAVMLGAELFGEGGMFRRRRPLPPPTEEELEAARRVRDAARRRRGISG